ncbi:MAG: methyltransferase [Polyangiaceae bacterium]|nr:methyltransferase [Polyangiaceae bacterium]
MTDELDERLRDPGFTPGLKLVSALLDRVARGDDDIAGRATVALGRVQSPVGAVARRAMEGMDAGERRKALIALASRPRTDDPKLVELATEALGDADARVRAAASRVLGKLGGEDAERALADALGRATTDPEKAAFARALAKTGGGERARAALAALDVNDPSLARARLIAERMGLRGARPAGANVGAALEVERRIVLACRRGLEPFVAEEVESLAPRARGRITSSEGRVELPWSGALAQLAAVRTALRVGVTFAAPRAAREETAAIADLLVSPDVRDVLRRMTEAPIRFRLAWADGGKRRGATWSVAEAVRASAAELVNDPTESDWEVVVHIDEARVAIDLFPRFEDSRFTYRGGDVPAASHPTIAAALARVAGVRDDDVVWDPFVGSGLELCERARLGGFRSLVGTDVDEAALRRADANLRAAGVARVDLRREDARLARVPGLTAVITNPPMGRRVLAQTDLPALMGEVIAHAARMLEPGGRIVLLSPHPRTTEREAERAGLETTLDRRVDMGGFDAVLQRFDKRGASGPLRSRAERGSEEPRTSPRPRGSTRGNRR